jgi:hypothetical protein
LKWSISSAEQHIVQDPHDFPGAAVIQSPRCPRSANPTALNDISIIVLARTRG